MTSEQRQPMDFGSPLPERSVTPVSIAQSVSEEPLQKVKPAVSSLMGNCESHALSENLVGLPEGVNPAVMFEVKIPVNFGNSESREMFLAAALFETWLHCTSPHYQICPDWPI
jgi:hypothetical protein